MSKVKVNHVSKVYDLNNSKKDKLISLFTFGNFYKEKPYYALRDVTFEVAAGDSVGIIGLNGSGKSTLSNILGEVTQPSSGHIQIEGRSSLIAISAGLNNELTGVENVKMKCLMHGMSEQEVNEKFDDIVAFSELDEFIYQPIKSYSSGMRSRLGFAIAIHTQPDVLIVDEALSVGDETFSNKCIKKMREFQERGVTIFFVSHSTSQIKQMCNKALWLQFGEVKEYGDCDKVTANYTKYMRSYRQKPKEEQLAYKKEMIQRQQEKGEAFMKQKEKKSGFDLLLGLGLTALYAVGTYFQLFH